MVVAQLLLLLLYKCPSLSISPSYPPPSPPHSHSPFFSLHSRFSTLGTYNKVQINRIIREENIVWLLFKKLKDSPFHN